MTSPRMYHLEEIRDHIGEYISAQSGLPSAEITDDCNFIAEGLLDSFAALTLIVFLEATFGTRFDPVELGDEAAQTVGGLARLVVEKQRGQS